MSRVTIRVEDHIFDAELTDAGIAIGEDVIPIHISPGADRRIMHVTAGDQIFHIDLRGPGHVEVDHDPFTDVELLELHGIAGAPDPTAGAYGDIRPPMTGKLVEIQAKAGTAVEAGDVLFVLEAMKMRNEVKAAGPGTVTAIHADEGAAVEPDQAILTLAPLE